MLDIRLSKFLSTQYFDFLAFSRFSYKNTNYTIKLIAEIKFSGNFISCSPTLSESPVLDSKHYGKVPDPYVFVFCQVYCNNFRYNNSLIFVTNNLTDIANRIIPNTLRITPIPALPIILSIRADDFKTPYTKIIFKMMAINILTV